MGVCSPACAAQRGSHLSLFLSLEWKPKFPPPLQNTAQAEPLPTASTCPCCQTAFVEHLVWLLIFSPENSQILLVALEVTPGCPKGGHCWSGVVRYGGGTKEPQALLCPVQNAGELKPAGVFVPVGLSGGWCR